MRYCKVKSLMIKLLQLKTLLFSFYFSADDFELLCDDGSRAAVTDYKTCNWGIVPSNAIVTTSAKSPEQRRGLQDFLKVRRVIMYISTLLSVVSLL